MGIFTVFMLVHCVCAYICLNVCVCGPEVPGLQPSQWECTLVTAEVKAW